MGKQSKKRIMLMVKDGLIALTVRIDPDKYQRMMEYLNKKRIRKQQKFLEYMIDYAIDHDVAPESDY